MWKIRKAIINDIEAVTAIYEHIHKMEADGLVRIGWNPSIYPVRATAEEASPCRALYGAAFPINSHHHQGIDRVGSGLTVTMLGDDGVAEEVVHRSLPVWAVQWHPEKMCLRFAREDTVSGLPILRKFVDSIQ